MSRLMNIHLNLTINVALAVQINLARASVKSIVMSKYTV